MATVLDSKHRVKFCFLPIMGQLDDIPLPVQQKILSLFCGLRDIVHIKEKEHHPEKRGSSESAHLSFVSQIPQMLVARFYF